MESQDYFPQELMEELISARKPFRGAFDTLYRRERIFKYVYWLENGAKPAFTLIGSWITPDMRAELAMWQSMSKKDFDDTDVVDTVTEELERRFGLDLAAAKVRAMDPELVRRHLPIWNDAADCLIPQKLGDFLIYGMQTYAQLSEGQSYAYRHTIADASLNLYLYHHGLAQIEPGTSDPRFRDVLQTNIKGIEYFANSQGGTVQWLTEPLVVFMRPPVGDEIPFASTTCEVVSADGQRVAEGLLMTGFRDMFLKLRVTGPAVFFDTDVGRAAMAAVNLDLADLVAQFGEPKPRD